MHKKRVDGESGEERAFCYDSSNGSEAEWERLEERCKQWIKREIAWLRQRKSFVCVCMCVCGPP